MSPPSSAPASKALNAILPLIASGQRYEAHQKARTFASRYAKSQQYDTAVEVLFQSSRELLKAGEQGSGTDLAAFLIEVYESKGETVNDSSRAKLAQLISLTGSSGSWRKMTIDKSIAWSAKHGPYPSGDPDLHLYVGELLYKEGAYDLAEPHLLNSGLRDSARHLAEAMAQWSAAGASPGAFALRGTIPYLQNGNILGARTFIIHYLSQLLSSQPGLQSSAAPSVSVGQAEVIITTDPVLNFCQLAVHTCQRAQGDKNRVIRDSWVRLCGTYQSKGGLLAQREVRQALSELSLLYFAIPPPRSQPVNPLGDMLSSMFGGPPGGGAQQPRVLSPPTATGAPSVD